MFDPNDKIINIYIKWFTKRCLTPPSPDQIENFTRDGYWHIKSYLERDYDIKDAFRLWDSGMDK
jgi:hypothetical protein